MTLTQTPRRPEDYLVAMQEARVSSPVSHVIQAEQGKAGIQEVLRQQYTLPDSLPSSDRDQGYATSSNSEVYAPPGGEVYAPGMFEVHAGSGAPRQEDYTPLNVDGLVDALPMQEAPPREREFSLPDLGPAQIQTGSRGHSELGSDHGSSHGSSSHGARNVSMHYASVSVPQHFPAVHNSVSLSSTAVMVSRSSNVHHHSQEALPHPPHNDIQPIIEEQKCLNGYYYDTRGNKTYEHNSVYRQVTPAAVRSYPELLNTQIKNAATTADQHQGPSRQNSVDSLQQSYNNRVCMPHSRPSSSQSRSSRPTSCPRSQSFDTERPGSVTLHTAPTNSQSVRQIAPNSRQKHRTHRQHSGRKSHSRQPQQNKADKSHQKTKLGPPTLDSSAADRFMFGNFNDDDGCSTCTDSTDSDEFDYYYHFSPNTGNKISYVTDNSGISRHDFAKHEVQGRRHSHKNKQCSIQ